MKKSICFIVIGSILCLSAVCLYGYNEIDAYWAAQDASKLLRTLEEDMLANSQQQIKADEEDGVMSSQMVDGLEIVGVISLPTVGIELPVAAQWNYDNLQKSACRYSGTAKDGRLIILAHNYRRHFGRLENVQNGDIVQFLDVNGNLYQYIVSEIAILGQNELDTLTESDSDLTLFTCTYSGQRRIVVRCQKQV